jgi:hypothetical protein
MSDMFNKDKNNITTAWQYYELGRSYNNSLAPSQYTVVNTNIEFFTGNQWRNLPQTRAMAALPKPVFNIIKRVTSLFVAALTSSGIAVRYEPLSYYGLTSEQEEKMQGIDPSEYATAEVSNLFDKFKMEYRIRQALFDGAQTGDYCAHFYWDPDAIPYGGAFGPYRGEIQMEMVDGINVMFGNPNSRDVERQPYIIVVGRETVGALRRELKQWQKQYGHKSKAQVEMDCEQIVPDSDNTYQAGIGGKHELAPDDARTGKALYVYLYTKKRIYKDVLDDKGNPVMEPVLDDKGEPIQEKDENGVPIVGAAGEPVYKMKPAKKLVTSVHVTKATKTAVIFEDVDTGLTSYPIAWGNWEHQKNQYHGRALVTGLIPNQIFINSMFAMVMRHLQLMGFPKTIYNQDLIGQWNNEVGQAIGVRGLQPGQAIGQVAANLQPGDMSAQIIYAIDKAMEYTKECMGATDVQMGAVKPDNTSAIMVLQSNAEVPLENTRALMYEWVEDVGHILLDMMGAYYGERPVVREREFDEPVIGSDGNPTLDPMTGQMMTQKVTRKVAEIFDFSKLKNYWCNVRCDVGATTYFSEIAMVQTLDNLRREGTLDIIKYLERIPDKLVPKKAELIADLKEQALAAQQAQGTVAGSNAPPVTMGGGGSGAPGGPVAGGELDTLKRVQNMPEGIQEQWNDLPSKVQHAVMKSGAGDMQI